MIWDTLVFEKRQQGFALHFEALYISGAVRIAVCVCGKRVYAVLQFLYGSLWDVLYTVVLFVQFYCRFQYVCYYAVLFLMVPLRFLVLEYGLFALIFFISIPSKLGFFCRTFGYFRENRKSIML